jgi:hypothetical protein
MLVALTLGRDDFWTDRSNYLFPPPYPVDWSSDACLHCLVRAAKLQDFLDHNAGSPGNFTRKFERMLALLALEKFDDALDAAKEFPRSLFNDAYYFAKAGLVFAETHHDAFFTLLPNQPPAAQSPENRYAMALVPARWAIEHRDFDAAAAFIGEFQMEDTWSRFAEVSLFQIMLSSLGRLKGRTQTDLIAIRDKRLSGTMLDLSEMFLGHKDPFPNELWPHPLWRPEWRLWLGLWHEAKGNSKAAHQVATPSLDERYGLTHSQPALRALVERTRAKL